MTSRRAIPPPPSFENLTPDGVLAETQDILNSTSTLHDTLAATFTAATADFARVIRPIVDDANRAACRLRILTTLLGQLSPDRELRHAVSSEIRRKFALAQQNRLPDNVVRLAKLVALRDHVARLLGFEHHAALKKTDKMAPSVAYVEDQLNDLHQRLNPIAIAEIKKLLRLKEMDSGAGELYSWDRAYYLHKQNQENFSVDHALLAEYFEVTHTLQGMLNVFNEIFGIKFMRIKTSVWHGSVVAYEAWDTPDEGGNFLGHLYVDIFDRKGKYRGAHHVMIQPGFTLANNEKHYPVSALVCSFRNSAPSHPSLLQHSEVKTMFHELGHAIHNIVARTKYSIPHSRDFIEIPSIMLENWIWLPDILARLGRHYETYQALPHDLAEGIARTRNANRASNILAQVQPALFDLAIHTSPTHKDALEMDTTAIWNLTKRDILPYSFGPTPQDLGAGQARFAHMFRKNDGGLLRLSLIYGLCGRHIRMRIFTRPNGSKSWETVQVSGARARV